MQLLQFLIHTTNSMQQPPLRSLPLLLQSLHSATCMQQACFLSRTMDPKLGEGQQSSASMHGLPASNTDMLMHLSPISRLSHFLSRSCASAMLLTERWLYYSKSHSLHTCFLSHSRRLGGTWATKASLSGLFSILWMR